MNSNKPLRLLYVGGIDPEVYDIANILRFVNGQNDLQLTICCREHEWNNYKENYEKFIGPNMELVHVGSNELARFYHRTDLFLMLMAGSEYRDFSAPVKLYEAIGYCTPIVSLNHKEVARTIHSAGIGWVIDNIEQFRSLLDKIQSERAMLKAKFENLLIYRNKCTWQARAAAAAEYLLHYQPDYAEQIRTR